MNLEFRLDKFEGPLDLLLHLIDKNKVDIYDIPIAQITDQYMEYMRGMDDADPDVMSEFLVMAATLLDIKCRMLLPREQNEEGAEEDPREELVRRLLEHKLYRELSNQLRDLSEGAAQSLYRRKNIPEEVQSFEPPIDYEQLIGKTTSDRLGEIFRDTLRRKRYRVDPVRSQFGRIEREKVDIAGKALYIRAYLNAHRDVDFSALLEIQGSREEIVAAFLIILELMKTGDIEVRQEETFGRIMIHVLHDIPASVGAEEFQ